MIVITQGSSFMIIRIIHISDDLDLDDEVDHDHVDKDDDGNHLHLRELADRLLPATKQLGTKVTLTSCNCNCENLKINHCTILKVIVLDDTWWADPRLGDLSEPLPPPLVEV